MPANDSGAQPPKSSKTFAQRAKHAALFVIFGAILIIPRIRRLRRRFGAWALVRLGAAGCATWLGWRYKHAGGGWASLAASLLLFAFSLLVRAKPEAKSVDAVTRELGALIVLNGGTFCSTPDAIPIRKAQIFVHPERIIVQDSSEHGLLAIPFTRLRSISAYPSSQGSDAKLWEVEIEWLSDVPCKTTFQYAGTFAEHLAEVTESTLRSQWSKGLPILQ